VISKFFRQIPDGEDNLVCKAARVMQEVYGLPGGVRITLTKRIPVAAGMAGGSTDAAATFLGLRDLYGLSVSDEELQRLALPLGADIPYCIAGGTRLSEGIGEKLVRLPDAPQCHLVLVKPPVAGNTGMVYRTLDSLAEYPHPDIDGMIDRIGAGDLTGMAGKCGNVLALVTGELVPVIGQIEQFFMDRGAVCSKMSGSGPSVFAIYQEEEKAAQALREFKETEDFSDCYGALTRFVYRRITDGMSTEESCLYAVFDSAAGLGRKEMQAQGDRNIDIVLESDDQSMPLRETVFQTLRKAILTGKLEPGERLTEIRLGKILGTSRTPIREAIRKLELEGLVTIVPGSGARVARITERQLQDVLEVRRALDMLCARLASNRITPEEKRELRKANEDFRDSVRKGNFLDIAEADVRFHDVIIRASKNQTMMTVLDRLADNIYRYRFEFIKDDQRYEKLISEHEDLYQAIVNGDGERAAEAAALHIERQMESVLQQLKKISGIRS
jgi:4-diphosphocytidyl-2-C-methyl-D-erythritol kinase